MSDVALVRCPPSVVLQRYSLGQLGSATLASLNEHISSCDRCTDTISRGFSNVARPEPMKTQRTTRAFSTGKGAASPPTAGSADRSSAYPALEFVGGTKPNGTHALQTKVEQGAYYHHDAGAEEDETLAVIPLDPENGVRSDKEPVVPSRRTDPSEDAKTVSMPVVSQQMAAMWSTSSNRPGSSSVLRGVPSAVPDDEDDVSSYEHEVDDLESRHPELGSSDDDGEGSTAIYRGPAPAPLPPPPNVDVLSPTTLIWSASQAPAADPGERSARRRRRGEGTSIDKSTGTRSKSGAKPSNPSAKQTHSNGVKGPHRVTSAEVVASRITARSTSTAPSGEETIARPLEGKPSRGPASSPAGSPPVSSDESKGSSAATGSGAEGNTDSTAEPNKGGAKRHHTAALPVLGPGGQIRTQTVPVLAPRSETEPGGPPPPPPEFRVDPEDVLDEEVISLEDGAPVAAFPRWGDTQPISIIPEGEGKDLHLPRGTPLGRYILLDELGSGGLGVVYEAYDPRLDRRLAIKLLRSGVEARDDGVNRDRLLREGQALARLSHPNVVAVHDVGRIGEQFFVAMELVEGLTLTEWIQQRQRSWKEIRDVMLEAAQGVAAAHAVGLVHRDFKPSNVLVSLDERGQPRRVRVLDFGLARAPKTHNAETASRFSIPAASGETPLLDKELTAQGTVVGTPQFMAPEQFGQNEIGPAADQFSFCVSLWVALYGERPFLAANVYELVGKIFRGEIDEPAQRRGVPNWFHRSLRKGLAYVPADRYASMEELIASLTHERGDRRRQWVALGLAALLSGGSAAAVAAYMGRANVVSPASAVDDLVDEARAAAAKSHYVYPPPNEPTQETAYRRVLALEALSGAVAELGNQKAAELRAEFADTLIRLGDQYYDTPDVRPFAQDYYAQALIFDANSARARERTSLSVKEIRDLSERARSGSFTRNELMAVLPLVALSLPVGEQRDREIKDLATNPSVAALTLAQIEEGLGPRGQAVVEAALSTAAPPVVTQTPETRSTGVSTPKPRNPTSKANERPKTPRPAASGGGVGSEALAKEGLSALRAAKESQAEDLFNQALEKDPNNATALAGLGELYFEQSSYKKALTYFRKAVSAAPRRGSYRVFLGDAYFKTSNYESALKEYEEAKKLGHPKAADRLKRLDEKQDP